MLEDSKKEILKRLDTENHNLLKIRQGIRDFDKYGETNPFDFGDANQQEDEINLNEF